MKSLNILSVLLIAAIASCTPHPENAQKVNSLPPVYPDYTDVTIPQNIAPLNFLVRGNAEAVDVVASFGGETLETGSDDNKACFDVQDWKRFMAEAAGKKVTVQVTAKVGDKWLQYKPFSWQVVRDSIDEYISYRLIEPDYEVFSNLQIRERCVENFEEKSLCDYNIVGNKCMNCHIVGNQNPRLSMMYVRGKGGGAVLNRDGKLRKLNIKKDGMVSPSVYGGFDPSGRYFVFSSNVIIPAFHAQGSKRLEVYDKKSDVYVADLDNNTIISCPQLSDSTKLETFPTFSPDGKSIYFCTAKMVKLPEDIKDLKYSLCRIGFDGEVGKFGTRVDTLLNANGGTTMYKGRSASASPSLCSVCHPRVSPDGKYILYTVQSFGTFPVWHRESDLQMMNLRTGAIDTLAAVNSAMSDTYHSWSSNSRWFVFASKRDDGLYGKPYFCYVDRNGKAHKPFVLPQENPDFYDLNLKSFNIPELSRDEVPFNTVDVQKLMKQDAETFK